MTLITPDTVGFQLVVVSKALLDRWDTRFYQTSMMALSYEMRRRLFASHLEPLRASVGRPNAAILTDLMQEVYER